MLERTLIFTSSSCDRIFINIPPLLTFSRNDCQQNVDTGNAGARLKTMVDYIFSSIDGVTVVVSTLVPSRDKDACTQSLNQQFRDMVTNYGDARIGLADHAAHMTIDMIGPDGIHPIDSGYQIMASVWWDAISKLEGAIQPPADVDKIDDSATHDYRHCDKTAGNDRGPIKISSGFGHDDGIYTHKSNQKGALDTAQIQKSGDSTQDATIPSQMYFAQLITLDSNRTGALDDWVRIQPGSDSKNTYYVRQNLGGGKFGSSQTFSIDLDCDTNSRYAWGDFNNDGLDDFWCISSDSSVKVSLNRGGNPPKFESIGDVTPSHDGYTADDVRVADIDGDGRFDYCLIHDNGDVGCWKNGGYGDDHAWQGYTSINSTDDVVFNTQGKDNVGVVFGK